LKAADRTGDTDVNSSFDPGLTQLCMLGAFLTAYCCVVLIYRYV
jgi:hypothetical protein